MCLPKVCKGCNSTVVIASFSSFWSPSINSSHHPSRIANLSKTPSLALQSETILPVIPEPVWLSASYVHLIYTTRHGSEVSAFNYFTLEPDVSSDHFLSRYCYTDSIHYQILQIVSTPKSRSLCPAIGQALKPKLCHCLWLLLVYRHLVQSREEMVRIVFVSEFPANPHHLHRLARSIQEMLEIANLAAPQHWRVLSLPTMPPRRQCISHVTLIRRPGCLNFLSAETTSDESRCRDDGMTLILLQLGCISR